MQNKKAFNAVFKTKCDQIMQPYKAKNVSVKEINL
jgi:hypothetical protein